MAPTIFTALKIMTPGAFPLPKEGSCPVIDKKGGHCGDSGIPNFDLSTYLTSTSLSILRSWNIRNTSYENQTTSLSRS